MSRLLAFHRTRASAAVLLAVALAACNGADAPQAPSAMTAEGATRLAGPVASTVSSPQVRITDARGRGVKDVLVRWRVTDGGGDVVNDSIRTNARGEAPSGGWTLGTATGTQTLTASADGVAPVQFTADAEAGAPVRLVRLSPDPQQATVDTPVPQPPSVRAEDLYGNPVAGVPVSFSVGAGDGTMAGADVVTDARGIATAGAWTLGTRAGMQVARATATGPMPVTLAAFTANARAGAPAELSAHSPARQDALSGRPVPSAPGVRVTDRFGNAVGQVPIVFATGAASGSVSGAAVVTDPANGTAFVGGWTLGDAPVQTLVATSTTMPGREVRFVANVAASLFDITVRYVGPQPSARQRLAIDRAVARWRGVILNETGTSRVVIPAGGCGRSWLPAIDTVVTNIIIFAQIGPIDGTGGSPNILGNANACASHPSTGLTVLGTMLFDSEDLQRLEDNGRVDDLIAHEMGHVLGIGTRWNRGGLLVGAGSDDPIFTGVQAREHFLGIGGGSYGGRPVPVENTGGGGTRDSHWRETVFRNELMTGFLNTGGNPISRVTVGSLADMGYLVTQVGAEPFTVGTASRVLDGFPASLIPLGDDVAPIPPGREARVYPVARPAPSRRTP